MFKLTLFLLLLTNQDFKLNNEIENLLEKNITVFEKNIGDNFEKSQINGIDQNNRKHYMYSLKWDLEANYFYGLPYRFVFVTVDNKGIIKA